MNDLSEHADMANTISGLDSGTVAKRKPPVRKRPTQAEHDAIVADLQFCIDNQRNAVSDLHAQQDKLLDRINEVALWRGIAWVVAAAGWGTFLAVVLQ